MPENRLQERFLRDEKTRTCVARFRHSTHALAGSELFLQNLQIASPWTPKRCKFCRGKTFREVLFADTVLFDFVLKRTEANAKQFGRLLSMVGDFNEGAADRFTLHILQRDP